MDILLDTFLDALIDSAKMLPLLFVIYVLIEFIEIRWGNRMGVITAKAGKGGPLIASSLGIIPQCGISVMATALYNQRLLTIGSLFAVYIATSDEAIPILLSQPSSAKLLVPILITKFVAAVVTGYLIDLVLHRQRETVETLDHIDHYGHGHDEVSHHHEEAFEQTACCGHTPTTAHARFTAAALLKHPLVHTLKVFAFIFLISWVLALLFAFVGQDTIAAVMERYSFAQPFLAGLVGIIPNCAASVAVTELYVAGTISFPAVIAGLSAGAGLGLVLLFKEGRPREAVAITIVLYLLSVAIGFIAGIFV